MNTPQTSYSFRTKFDKTNLQCYLKRYPMIGISIWRSLTVNDMETRAKGSDRYEYLKVSCERERLRFSSSVIIASILSALCRVIM
jgi:hypothetical protein